MALTDAQYAQLKSAILADTDPAVVAARNARNDGEIARLYNLDAVPTVKAWLKHASRRQIFEAMNLNLFDSVVPGKRAAWEIMMQLSDIDFGKTQYRNAIDDIWSAQNAAQRDAIYLALTESASKVEAAYGGTNRVGGTISALDRNWEGALTTDDVSTALSLP
jgi:hypothetical protein